ncbi:MAG: hypothetical protein ACXQTV_03585 [Candidatus Hecatellaceae archaeon]
MHLDDWWREVAENFRLSLKPVGGGGLGLILQPGEEVYGESGEASLYRVRELLPGGLTGVSVRAAEGVYLRQYVGGVSREKAWRLEAKGKLYLTNRRLIFAGDKGFTWVMPLNRLVRVDATWGELILASESEACMIRFSGESQFRWRWMVSWMASEALKGGR